MTQKPHTPHISPEKQKSKLIKTIKKKFKMKDSYQKKIK